MKNDITRRIISGVLAIGISLCAAGSIYADDKTSTEPEETKPEVSDAEVIDTQSHNTAKVETVYVIANSDGSVKKIIVSDWLKNPLSQSTLNDYTDLADIVNVRGNETFSANGNTYTWDAQGNDIYYQGTTEKALPIDLSISYKLDGQPISASELSGKSGRVTIRFDYKNNQKETVDINGEQCQIYVPFITVTGLLLNNDHFTNVEVSNGKIVNDGSRTVVMGFALPGMQENLDISKDTLELPDYVELTADVTNFEIPTTLTLVTNEVFNELDVSDTSSIDELKSSLDKLKDATIALIDGSSELYDGLGELLDKSGQLVSGIDQLDEGGKKVASGAADLSKYMGDLNSGLKDIDKGLQQITDNNASLQAGAKQVFEALLQTANTQLAAAGLSVPALTIDNYKSVLNGVLGNLSEDAIYNMAYNTAKDTVTQAVTAQEETIKAGVTQVVRAQVLEAVLAAVGQPMTAEQYEAAVAGGLINDATKAQIEGAVSAQMATEDIQGKISAATEQQKQQIISEKLASDEVNSQIQAALASAKAGSDSITALIAQLDSYQTFYQGLLTYTNGVSTVEGYMGSACESVAKLQQGASTLSNGADQLKDGLGTLKEKSGALTEGVTKLKDGSKKLSDGIQQFYDEGIGALTGLGDDAEGLTARLRAIVDVSKDYRSFSGSSDTIDGTVRFIYKTE